MENLKVDLFDEEVFVFTPKGEVKSLAAGRDAAGLRLRDPHRARPPLRRREGQRQDRPAELRADLGRHRRGADLQARARPVARLARGGQDDARAQQDQAVLQGRVARGHRAHRAATCCRSTSRRRACRPRRSPARRCWPTSSARWASARPTTSTSRWAARRSRRRSSSTRSCSASSRARRPRRRRSRRVAGHVAASAPADGRVELLRHPGRGRRRRHAAPGQVLSPGARRPDRRLHLARPRHHDPPRRLPEHGRAAQGPGALRARPLGGRRTRRVQGRARRSTPGTATACSRTSRAPSPRPASTSSRRAASSPADGQEPLRRRGRRHARCSRRTVTRLRNIDSRLRRLPRHAGAG